MEESIADVENKVEEMDSPIREKVLNLKERKKKKEPSTKHPRNLGHYEKNRSANNRNRGRKRSSGQRQRKYFH